MFYSKKGSEDSSDGFTFFGIKQVRAETVFSLKKCCIPLEKRGGLWYNGRWIIIYATTIAFH